MKEVDGPNFSVNQVNFNRIQKQANDVEPETHESKEEPKITDFSDSKAEALGRSMLFKGNDNVNNDLKALEENPQIAENSDELFEILYSAAQDAGLENPYEEAASASTVSV